MEYLKNKFKIDFEKKCRRGNGGVQNIVSLDHMHNCENIFTDISVLIDAATLDAKKRRFKNLFQLTSIDAERETQEVLDCVQIYINDFYISPIEYIWLKNVISITENVPICITIAPARKRFFGFPLIYANKQFEKTTEYRRKDIIGKNCKFLQPKIPLIEDETQHKILKRSIELGIPASVIITNVKKSGELFYNLISLKPVTDKDGIYLYNIGIQTELTRNSISDADVQNIADLMHILSNVKINVISSSV